MTMMLTFHELKEKNVHELREIAKEINHEALQGYTQLNKEHLLVALAKALNLPTHEHHAQSGFDKSSLKAQMRTLHKKREEAVAAGDAAQLHAIRRQIHHINHEIRRHTTTD